ncbi:MAG: DUF1722 domain-containing protein [Anaerolineae bacterium]
MDFLTNHLSSEDNAYRRCICGRLELLGLIEDYRQGLLPLIVPLTLLKHHVSCYPVPDWVPACPRVQRGCPTQHRVHQQVYLHQNPKELMLRNHV